MIEQVYNQYYDTAGNYHWTGVYSGEHILRKGEKMTEGEKLMCLMIRRFLDENPDKEIITYVHMVDGEYRHEVEIREKKVKTA